MVNLADQGEAIFFETLDDPDLPEGAGPIQALGHDASREALELLFVTGTGQAGMAQVVVEVEAVVVHPHRLTLEGDPGELLSVAGNPVQDSVDPPPDQLDVDPAVRSRERPDLVDAGGGHVHVGVGLLEEKEGVVQGSEADRRSTEAWILQVT